VPAKTTSRHPKRYDRCGTSRPRVALAVCVCSALQTRYFAIEVGSMR
jgi:hypothetical protein